MGESENQIERAEIAEALRWLLIVVVLGAAAYVRWNHYEGPQVTQSLPTGSGSTQIVRTEQPSDEDAMPASQATSLMEPSPSHPQ